MRIHHGGLADDRWRRLTLAEQMGNVGSEVSRALRWQGRDQALFERAMERALELLDLTIEDPRWRSRLKELVRARELLCDAWFGGSEYGSSLAALDRYFFQFALFARAQR